MQIFITVTGSRRTPDHILNYLSRLSCRLQSVGITVRTGDAVGADSSARSCDSLIEVYAARDGELRTDAHTLAAKYHGAWDRCGMYARNLHARNCFQVAGRDLSNPVLSECVICWTPDGCETHAARSVATGDTGTVISIAEAEFHIPVFNLYNDGRSGGLIDFLVENVVPRSSIHTNMF